MISVSKSAVFQNLIPERGRKRRGDALAASKEPSFSEPNPRKGTETLYFWDRLRISASSFSEPNPRKGTETLLFGGAAGGGKSALFFRT